jgi:isopenicillin-N N-acyltransferase-like protein
MSDLPIIELDQIDPLARGRAYGEAARDKISFNLDFYQGLFMTATGEAWPDILGRGRLLKPLAEAYAPDLLVEIDGIAQGAGRSWEEIFLLNARSEIIFSSKGLGLEPREPDDCTSLLALPETTEKRDTFLAQNWDWYGPMIDGQVILKIGRRESIPALVTFTEAGQVAKMGMNAAGVGLAVNNLTADRPRPGVPWLLITRRILESSRLTEAAGRVLAAPRAHSINYLIGHGGENEGFGVCLETAAGEEHIFWPDRGFLAHTNHFIEPGRTFEDLKLKLDPYSSTHLRLARTRSLLQGESGRLGAPAIRKILSDHYDHPFSVCAHGTPYARGVHPVETCLSLVMNLTRKRIEYCLGQPCKGEWRELQL